MEFEFTKATIIPFGNSCLMAIEAPKEQAVEFLEQMREGKTYTAKFTERKKKRSLDANGLYWELCGRLSQKIGIPPEEIYRNHIRDIGNYEPLCMPEEALDSFKELWCSNHTGRFVQTRDSKIPGCVTVLAYYGSSDFNTKQMSLLIDNCMQDCHENGVETRPREEVESLLAQWE